MREGSMLDKLVHAIVGLRDHDKEDIRQQAFDKKVEALLYSALKGLEGEQKNGRADLWIYNPKSSTLAIEAKFRWAWKALKPKKLLQKLDEAVKDALCYQGGDKRIGAVFIVPF